MSMRRGLYFLAVGAVFGVVMLKSGAASWYRIYEMFRFGSFHMYGIMGAAVAGGLLFNFATRRFDLHDLDGNAMRLSAKPKLTTAPVLGGLTFGLGWAVAGACPGPIYTLIGAGFWPVLLVLLGALGGAFAYGALRNRLPH